MRFLLVALAALLAAGCASTPAHQRPKVEVPEAWKEAGEWKAAEPNDATARGPWWEAFSDSRLGALIAELDAASPTLAAAEAQLRQASALAAQARTAWWPTLNASVQQTRSKPSSTTGGITGQPTTRRVIYSLPFSASWEVDLWGRIRHAVEQGEAGEAASAADLVNARLSAHASLAQSYFQLRALDAERALLEQTTAAYAKSLELTRNRYAAGIASRADVAAAEAQLYATRAQALELGLQRAQLEHAIAVLVGRPASSFGLASEPKALPAAPPALPAPGLPATLLERRPDIAAAERRVAAANAQIGVARAAFFPVATLSASWGLQSATPEKWFTVPSRFWSLGPALALALIDAGRREAVSEQALAAHDQASANYRGVVLAAFREVEDALAALRLLGEEAEVQAVAVRAAAQALEHTTNQYKAGIVNYLQVVQAQTTALAAERSAVALRGRRLVASVQLVRALGGGWSDPGASNAR